MAEITFWHGPMTRSTGTLALLEELGVSYDLRKVDVRGGESRTADFLEINPAGKVPVIRHGDTIVAELAAISLYLCDAFPEAGLAPAIGDKDRADYLYWSVFRPGVLEPAMIAKTQGWEPNRQMVGWGDWETMLARIEQGLEGKTWLLGERFSGADILVGGALVWLKSFGVLPERAAFEAYIERMTKRPSMQKVGQIDAQLTA